MAMGSVLVSDKGKVHQGFRQTNLNIAELAQWVWPDLSVIDGLVGTVQMQVRRYNCKINGLRIS